MKKNRKKRKEVWKERWGKNIKKIELNNILCNYI